MEQATIRECTSIEDFDNCVYLQKEVFGLPDLEISPRRHLVVTGQAGGWTLGAFAGERLVGFVHHLAAVRNNNEIFGYSHMMAVARDYQNQGVGARLKWAQREKAVGEGRNFIKWTWDPMQTRNAHFNLNRLGVTVDTFADNFYGTDYNTDPAQLADGAPGIQSDRLFARWNLNSARVIAFSKGEKHMMEAAPVGAIAIPAQWSFLVKKDVKKARAEQERVRREFKEAFARDLICAGFDREPGNERYLLFRASDVSEL